MKVYCANYRHPDGEWHLATPLSYSWRLLERFRQYRNRQRWGCICHRKAREDS